MDDDAGTPPPSTPKLVLAFLVGGAVAGPLAMRSSVGAAATAACEPGRVPVVWPLGADGFRARPLLKTHAQYQAEEGSAWTHQGIDIAAEAGEDVYAVAAGLVVYVDDGVYEDYKVDDYQYKTVVVSDGDDLSRGFKYQHLDDIEVLLGSSVQRDQVLGTVLPWSDYCGYDHLHLQRVEATGYEASTGGTVWSGLRDLGNPLPWLAARPDGVSPHLAPVAPGVAAKLEFYKADGSAFGSQPLTGTVDVVAELFDLFPGDAPPLSAPAACCPDSVSKKLAPYRLTLSVRKPVAAETASGAPITTYEEVWTNTITLDGPNPESEAEALAKHIYHESSVGQYDQRRLRFLVTRCAEDGSGGWDTAATLGALAAPVSCRLELCVEDGSGNVAVEVVDVLVDP